MISKTKYRLKEGEKSVPRALMRYLPRHGKCGCCCFQKTEPLPAVVYGVSISTELYTERQSNNPCSLGRCLLCLSRCQSLTEETSILVCYGFSMHACPTKTCMILGLTSLGRQRRQTHDRKAGVGWAMYSDRDPPQPGNSVGLF